MAAYVEDAPVFVDALYALPHLLLEHVEFPAGRHGREGTRHDAVDIVRVAVQLVVYFLENPGTAKGGAANHHGIHAISLKRLARPLGGGDVAVADDGDAHPGIAFHLADERPVGLTGVHLRPGPAMDGQGLYAAVLQLFGQWHDDAVFHVPPQTGLGRHGHLHGIGHGTGYLEHTRDVLQQSRPGTFARHALHGATEVDVQHIGAGTFHHNLGGIAHGHGVFAVNLDGYGPFGVTHGEFFQTLVDHTHQRIGGHELRVDHGGTEAAAKQTETDVGNVLHGCQQHRARTQVKCSYFHIEE